MLMISSDFEEVAATCFRALVFERGRIVAELRKPNVSQEQLTRFASGEHRDGARGCGKLNLPGLRRSNCPPGTSRCDGVCSGDPRARCGRERRLLGRDVRQRLLPARRSGLPVLRLLLPATRHVPDSVQPPDHGHEQVDRRAARAGGDGADRRQRVRPVRRLRGRPVSHPHDGLPGLHGRALVCRCAHGGGARRAARLDQRPPGRGREDLLVYRDTRHWHGDLRAVASLYRRPADRVADAVAESVPRTDLRHLRRSVACHLRARPLRADVDRGGVPAGRPISLCHRLQPPRGRAHGHSDAAATSSARSSSPGC